MTPKLERLKVLLREEWDPIGLMPHLPDDEYDGYAREIWLRLSGGESVDGIVAYLTWAAGEHIGVDTDAARERAVAEAAARIVGLQET